MIWRYTNTFGSEIFGQALHVFDGQSVDDSGLVFELTTQHVRQNFDTFVMRIGFGSHLKGNRFLELRLLNLHFKVFTS